jgi:hypothetical protein
MRTQVRAGFVAVAVGVLLCAGSVITGSAAASASGGCSNEHNVNSRSVNTAHGSSDDD